MVLPITGREIFAYGGIIYNPGGGHIGPELIAHEEIHFTQQGSDPAGWWDKYLKEPEFRLEQELEAHIEEYRVFCRLNRDRNRRSVFLHTISHRLAAPMYGGLLTAREASAKISKG